MDMAEVLPMPMDSCLLKEIPKIILHILGIVKRLLGHQMGTKQPKKNRIYPHFKENLETLNFDLLKFLQN